MNSLLLQNLHFAQGKWNSILYTFAYGGLYTNRLTQTVVSKAESKRQKKRESGRKKQQRNALTLAIVAVAETADHCLVPLVTHAIRLTIC